MTIDQLFLKTGAQREQRGLTPLLMTGLILIFGMTLSVGCQTFNPKVSLPPVSDHSAGQIKQARFVWIDLITEDTVAAAAFYGGLLNWQAVTSKEDPGYYQFLLENRPIAGMTRTEGKDDAIPESLWLPTISVEDVDQTVAAVTAEGGKLLEGPLNAEGRGRMALVSDASQAPFILLNAPGSTSAGPKAGPGQWQWIDLFTTDPSPAYNFYTKVFGYTVWEMETNQGYEYDIIRKDGKAIAGIVTLKWEGLEDNWLPFFKVTDLDQTIADARKLGGRLIVRSGNAAVLADPTGAAFGVQMPGQARR